MLRRVLLRADTRADTRAGPRARARPVRPRRRVRRAAAVQGAGAFCGADCGERVQQERELYIRADNQCRYGVVARVVQSLRLPNGNIRVMVEGEDDVLVDDIEADDDLIEAGVADDTEIWRLYRDHLVDDVRRRDKTPDRVLAAADPAQPYGAALPWPRRGDDDRRPFQRAAGAYVVLVDGAAVLYVERGGKGIATFPAADDPERAQLALAALGGEVRIGKVSIVAPPV